MAKASRGGSRTGYKSYSANERAKIETYKGYLSKGYDLYAPKEKEDLKYQVEAVKQYYNEKIKSLDKGVEFPNSTSNVPDSIIRDIMGKNAQRGVLYFKKIGETKDTVDLVQSKYYDYVTSNTGTRSVPVKSLSGSHERSIFRKSGGDESENIRNSVAIYTLKKADFGYTKKAKTAEYKTKMNGTIERLTKATERKFGK